MTGDCSTFPAMMQSIQYTRVFLPAVVRSLVIERKQRKWKTQCPPGYRLGIDGALFISKTVH